MILTDKDKSDLFRLMKPMMPSIPDYRIVETIEEAVRDLKKVTIEEIRKEIKTYHLKINADVSDAVCYLYHVALKTVWQIRQQHGLGMPPVNTKTFKN